MTKAFPSIKYLFSTYYVPGTIVGIEMKVMNKTFSELIIFKRFL